MKYGLLGQQLIHSYSPRIHHTLGTTDYGLVEQNPKQVDTFLDTTDMIGLNVTIPYKEVALAHCNHISQIAERIGCINTMVKRDGTWFGDNTDYNGVIYALRYANISVDRKQCLILGDGATSKTVHVALEDLGASDIITREEFAQVDKRPILSSRFAGGIDTVGGPILENVLKTLNPLGAVTTCGSVSATQLNMSVFPFILRGISLIGISAQNYPMHLREPLWQKLATDWKPAHLMELYNEIALEDLISAIDLILQGKLKGRTLVKIQ